MTLTRHSIDELYVAGNNVNVNPDPEGEPITVFLRKLSPSQQQKAIRKANAARVVVMRCADFDDDDEEKMAILADVDNKNRDEWIELLAEVEIVDDKAKIEQELSEEEEWADDGKLQSLVDAWEDLLPEWLKGEEAERYEEAKSIYDEMKRFTEAIEAKLAVRRREAVEDLEELSDEELRQKVFNFYLTRAAGVKWLEIFRSCQILYGAEDPDSHEKLYSSIDQIENLPTELWVKYIEGINESNISPTDVKS